MGGFHGGHHSSSHSSSHSGFHGGHSSSHSSFHSSSSSSSYYRRKAYKYNGKTYYKPHYAEVGGSEMSFISALAIGIALLFIGIGLFLAFLKVETRATITKAQIIGPEYDRYEVYDFEYQYNGETYFGYGDDDLASDGSLSILVGEEYSLYVSPIFPANYDFFYSSIGVIFAGFVVMCGVVWTITTIAKKSKFKKDLKEIGDINNDGRIDEKDLDYAAKLNDGLADGAYEGAKAAEEKNVYEELTKKYCPYCGVKVDSSIAICNNCGGTLK